MKYFGNDERESVTFFLSSTKESHTEDNLEAKSGLYALLKTPNIRI